MSALLVITEATAVSCVHFLQPHVVTAVYVQIYVRD